MTLLNDLYEVYKANTDTSELIDEAHPLIPLGYTSTTVHIKVKLNQNGEFLGARTCEAKQHELVPCTIESAGRSSGITPHPLHDKLTYVAGDLEGFGVAFRKTKQKETAFQLYLQQLEAWAQSPDADTNVKAIYQYVAQKSVIKDLVDQNILYVDETGVLVDKWPGDSKDPEKNEIFKLVTNKQSEAFIYFEVDDGDGNTDETANAVANSWATYYLHYLDEHGQPGLDYVTGKQEILTTNHARDIRHGGDGAKLISSNDTSGFTYRGRFLSADQAASVGYETSNKAFNALKWLISRQGYPVNDRMFVAWGEHGEKEPLPTDSRGRPVPVEDPTDVNFAKKQFQSFLKGWNQNLESSHRIHILILDAATPGRMDLVYYRSYDQQQYFDRLGDWYADLSILVVNKGELQQKTVPLLQLAYAAYGDRIPDALKAETILRLVRCVTDNAQDIPQDLRNLITKRAGKPLASSENDHSWQNALQAAVAVNQKHYGSEGISVALDKNDQDRSYLFGRLLAVADKVESDVLRDRGEKRATAAMRYMSAFEQHPDSTWQTIHRMLVPYFARNSYGDYYQSLITEIMVGVNEHDTYNKPLNAKYLTGFYHQKNYLYTKHATETQEDEK